MNSSKSSFSIIEYFKVPSKAPYAWLFFILFREVIGAINHYTPDDYRFFLKIVGYLVTIAFVIQLVSNIYNFVKKPKRLNLLKIIIVTVLLVVLVIASKVLSVLDCPSLEDQSILQECLEKALSE